MRSRRYRCTASEIPAGEETPPMVATRGQVPSASDEGTWIATWYRPANPGASAAPNTVACTLLMVTFGSAPVEYV